MTYPNIYSELEDLRRRVKLLEERPVQVVPYPVYPLPWPQPAYYPPYTISYSGNTISCSDGTS